MAGHTLPAVAVLLAAAALVCTAAAPVELDPAEAAALAKWLPNQANPCDVSGVTCGHPTAGTTHVLAIALHHKLSGAVLDVACSFPHMNHLDLSDNALTGCIPPCVVAAPALQYLLLSRNRLEGSLPNITAAGLKALHVDSNVLSGSLPAAMFHAVAHLQQLDVSNNRFNGTLPEPLADNHLQRVSVAGNGFTGAVPFGLVSAPHLEGLHVDNNFLSGAAPLWSSFGSSVLDTLDVSDNCFTTVGDVCAGASGYDHCVVSPQRSQAQCAAGPPAPSATPVASPSPSPSPSPSSTPSHGSVPSLSPSPSPSATPSVGSVPSPSPSPSAASPSPSPGGQHGGGPPSSAPSHGPKGKGGTPQWVIPTVVAACFVVVAAIIIAGFVGYRWNRRPAADATEFAMDNPIHSVTAPAYQPPSPKPGPAPSSSSAVAPAAEPSSSSSSSSPPPASPSSLPPPPPTPPSPREAFPPIQPRRGGGGV